MRRCLDGRSVLSVRRAPHLACFHLMVVGHVSPGQSMRLAKYRDHAGVASRRAAEAMIGEGRVTLAGQVVLDPARDVDEQSPLAVDGSPIAGPEHPVVYALN